MLVAVAIFLLLVHHPSPQLPIYSTVADFTLTERSGKPVSLTNLKGKWWIADFIFTNCPGQCPLLAHQMSQLQKQLPPSILLVSFTVDPIRDTQQVLSNYAKTYGAQKERWLFLTGDKQMINQVTTSCYMNTLEDPNLHSLRFILVDRKGQIRGYYDGTDKSAIEKLMKDVNLTL